MRRTVYLALTLIMTASVVLPGAATATEPTAESLRWGPCPEDVTGAELECSTLDVPLDYRDPDGQTIEVAISRLPSKNPEKRRGVLLTNAGGPGGVGLNFPAELAEAGLPQSVLDGYDVIGMDPRGVGHSTPVTCDMTPEQQWWGNLPPYANSAAEVAQRADEVKAIAEQCGESATGSLLPFITTANAARDMDRIREALGESTTSFLGYSYGTQLGSVFTTLFPERSDRIVLDSNLPPGGFDGEAMRQIGPGFEERVPDFAKFAAAHPEYGLGATPAEVTAKFFELAARLDATPRPDGVDGKLFRIITLGALYRDSRLPQLAETWRALDTGQSMPPGEDPSGEIPPGLENGLASHLYVACGDAKESGSVAKYQRDVAIDRVLHPMYGPAAANIRPCAFWPNDPIEPPVAIGDRGPSNVMLVQNQRDPATPLAGAKRLREAFGDRATMVTADQGGHGVYVLAKNRCATDTVTAYLADGQRPPEDVACAAEPA